MKDFKDCFRLVLSEYAMKMQKEEDKAFEKDHPEGTNASIEKFINSLSRENKEDSKEQAEVFDLEREIERIIGYVMDDNCSTLREDLKRLYNEGHAAGYDKGFEGWY